jgi:hypothetical protein
MKSRLSVPNRPAFFLAAAVVLFLIILTSTRLVNWILVREWDRLPVCMTKKSPLHPSNLGRPGERK